MYSFLKNIEIKTNRIHIPQKQVYSSILGSLSEIPKEKYVLSAHFTKYCWMSVWWTREKEEKCIRNFGQRRINIGRLGC